MVYSNRFQEEPNRTSRKKLIEIKTSMTAYKTNQLQLKRDIVNWK